MKHFFSALAAGLLPFFLFAQTWGPGTNWHYYQFEFFGDPHINTISITGDTILDGLDAFVLSGYCYCGNPSPFLRKVGNRVYFYEAGEFYLLYDFSLNAGDTLEIFSPLYNCQGEPIRFPIDSVSYFQTLGGVLLKVQHLNLELQDNCAYYLGSSIIENIGSDNCLFPISGVCDPGTGPLLCFETADGAYYPVPADECTVATNEKPGATFVQLTPSVISDHFQVRSAGPAIRRIRVFNLAGQLVLEQKLEDIAARVNWPDAPAGVYFVEVQLADGRQLSRKVVR